MHKFKQEIKKFNWYCIKKKTNHGEGVAYVYVSVVVKTTLTRPRFDETRMCQDRVKTKTLKKLVLILRWR